MARLTHGRAGPRTSDLGPRTAVPLRCSERPWPGSIPVTVGVSGRVESPAQGKPGWASSGDGDGHGDAAQTLRYAAAATAGLRQLDLGAACTGSGSQNRGSGRAVRSLDSGARRDEVAGQIAVQRASVDTAHPPFTRQRQQGATAVEQGSLRPSGQHVGIQRPLGPTENSEESLCQYGACSHSCHLFFRGSSAPWIRPAWRRARD